MSFGQFIVSQQENPQGGGGWAGSLMDHIRWKGKLAIFKAVKSLEMVQIKIDKMMLVWSTYYVVLVCGGEGLFQILSCLHLGGEGVKNTQKCTT